MSRLAVVDSRSSASHRNSAVELRGLRVNPVFWRQMGTSIKSIYYQRTAEPRTDPTETTALVNFELLAEPVSQIVDMTEPEAVRVAREARARLEAAIVAVEQGRVPPRLSDWPAVTLERAPAEEDPTATREWLTLLARGLSRLGS